MGVVDDSKRIGLVLVGLQITLAGVMMAVLAASGLQYWSPDLAIIVTAAGFVLSVPALLVGRADSRR